MSAELDVGFAWNSSYSPERVDLLLTKAAGIYKDPFNGINSNEDNYSTYELVRSSNSDTNSFIKVISLGPGIYHFVFRIFRSRDNEGELMTSDFYSKTFLATGREVNYVDVSPSNNNKSINYGSVSTRDDSFHTAQEFASESSKAPLLDYYDEEEEEKQGICCTLL